MLTVIKYGKNTSVYTVLSVFYPCFIRLLSLFDGLETGYIPPETCEQANHDFMIRQISGCP
jgi:hypothetical protein